jgi:hypothetical protein
VRHFLDQREATNQLPLLADSVEKLVVDIAVVVAILLMRVS